MTVIVEYNDEWHSIAPKLTSNGYMTGTIGDVRTPEEGDICFVFVKNQDMFGDSPDSYRKPSFKLPEGLAWSEVILPLGGQAFCKVVLA